MTTTTNISRCCYNHGFHDPNCADCIAETERVNAEPVGYDDDGQALACPDCGVAADATESAGEAQYASFPCGNGREYVKGAVVYTDECSAHWAERIEHQGLHEPTVRAIIDTMKRTGARFAAHVLECQYRNDQVTYEANEEATRLRELADFVEAHPDFPLRLEGRAEWSQIYIGCTDAAEMVANRRVIGGSWAKQVTDTTFFLDGKLGLSHIRLYTARDAVCERVVTGTEIKLVPDPDAPKIEKEVEIVEWICPDNITGSPMPTTAPQPVNTDDDCPF